MDDTPQVDAPRITIDELKTRLQAGEDFVFLDTRNPQAWAQSSLKVQGAIRVPVDDLDQYISEIPKDKSIVSYCT